MGRYFGTDGFRGRAGRNLRAEHAYKVGRYIGYYYLNDYKGSDRPKIVIGKDTRRSSYMIEHAVTAGLTASGVDAYLIHVTTTPCISYITNDEDFVCGIMISASHNPYYDNGIKILNCNGEKIDDNLQNEIEDYIDGIIPEIPYASDDKIGEVEDFYFGRNRYIGYLTALAQKSLENCKVGIDCANGSTWMIARAVFDALGAKPKVINNNPTGLNINLDSGSTHPEALQKFVKDNLLDVGFAFDGDGDRVIAVDETGELIDGDAIIYICAKYMKEKDILKKDTVVTTVMSNYGLYKALDQEEIAYEKTDVGDRYVYECMKKNGYSLGGEQSGHIIFGDVAHTGDGMVTAIMLMNVMIKTHLPLSILARGLKKYPQVLKNVVVDDKESTLKDSEVIKTCDECSKELYGKGRVLLRASGTEPVLRVMAEAQTQEKANLYVDHIIASIARKGHLMEILHTGK